MGTSGVDFGSITTVDNYFIGAQQAADTIGVTANLSNGTLKGGQGTDTISFTAGASITSSFVNSNSNNDTIGNAAGNANFFTSTVLGGQGNDLIQIGTIEASTGNGNKGNDTTTAATVATATLFGGQGDDSINATASSSSRVSGDLGDDTLTLGAGTHTSGFVQGGAGVDTITVTALAANSTNTFTNNTINGGAGDDTVTVNARAATDTGLVVNGDAGIDTIAMAGFTAAATIDGGSEGDIITSGTAADTVLGGTGVDAITNTAGADVITAGTGTDTVTLVAGAANTETINQGASDSAAATVAWTNIGGANGRLTEDNSVITFGNGIDTVIGFATTVDQANVVGATATQWNINNNVNALAAGGYFIRGDYAEGTQQFTVNLDTGADTLYINSNGGSLATAANNGSASIVFTGAVLVANDFA